MDIGAFRFGMFEFACGARMTGLWRNWECVNDMDLNHVCSREDVMEFCMDWARLHDAFGDICVQLSALANGDYKKEHNKYLKLAKKNAGSENASAVFSGIIEYAALQARRPSVRQKKELVNEQTNLEAITTQLQLLWDGQEDNIYADEASNEERNAVSLK
jgi:hypothetical protein